MSTTIYTPELSKEIVEKYQAGVPVKEIALNINTSERSVISKLTSLGVYKRKTYVNKRGEPPMKKEKYIEELALCLGVDPDRLESLEKANKNVLILLLNALQ